MNKAKNIAWGSVWLALAYYLLIGASWTPSIGNTSPIKADKPSLYIIEETKERGSYTPDQRYLILSVGPTSVAAKIRAQGGEFLVLDQDNTDLSKLEKTSPAAAEAFKLPREKLPWMVGGGPKGGGTTQAVPPNMPEILKAAETIR